VTETRRLEGRRALVTGAASGIGRAGARRLAAEGAAVAVLDRDAAGVTAVADAIRADGGRAIEAAVDVADEAAVAAAVAECERAWGGLDIAVASAAVQLFGQDDRADRLELEVWNTTIAINLTGVFLTCKHAAAAMLRGDGGSIVCIGSPTGVRGIAAGFDAYSASKAGVLGLVRVMAMDYAREGIRVNAVVPGFTDTGLVSTITSDPERMARINEAIPLGRAGRPEEVAGLVAWLCSDEAAYATGGIFVADGGVLAG
jgi:3-oxoacyl-[acyl-carrier protein] reductase